jgi:hypothetical protein
MTKGETEKEKQEEAARILREAERSETVGTSLLARTAESLRPEDDPNDPAFVWGKRVGRALGVIALILLAAYLFAEYGPRR